MRQALMLSAAVLAVATLAWTQEPAPSQEQVAGSNVYRTYCAVCHGPSAKGDGTLARNLRFKPPDLTLLARKNGGAFPRERVTRTVDGRNPVKGHGGPDMPVWGDAFKQTREGYSEEQVRARIAALVEFLESVQSGGARP